MNRQPIKSCHFRFSVEYLQDVGSEYAIDFDSQFNYLLEKLRSLCSMKYLIVQKTTVLSKTSIEAFVVFNALMSWNRIKGCLPNVILLHKKIPLAQNSHDLCKGEYKEYNPYWTPPSGQTSRPPTDNKSPSYSSVSSTMSSPPCLSTPVSENGQGLSLRFVHVNREPIHSQSCVMAEYETAETLMSLRTKSVTTFPRESPKISSHPLTSSTLSSIIKNCE